MFKAITINYFKMHCNDIIPKTTISFLNKIKIQEKVDGFYSKI